MEKKYYYIEPRFMPNHRNYNNSSWSETLQHGKKIKLAAVTISEAIKEASLKFKASRDFKFKSFDATVEHQGLSEASAERIKERWPKEIILMESVVIDKVRKKLVFLIESTL
jgi:hypothetical protein